MTDRCTEHLVKKVPDSSDRAKKFLLIAGIIALIAVTVLIAVMTSFYLILVLTIAAVYGGYFLFSSMNVEYEYTFINGELDVDKIMGQRKRQHLISLDVSKFTAFGKADADMPESTDSSTLFLCSDNTGEGEYYADTVTDDYGETRLVFTPSEKMTEYIEEALPPALKFRRRNNI